MSQIGIFEIVGPIMVGPSSSHTAGAVRLGYASRQILGVRLQEADIYLHGSFAATYWGHRTDIALIAGLLGMRMDDPSIPKAVEKAHAAGLTYQFQETDLGDVHPNSVRLTLRGEGEAVTIEGASIGGGRIRIFRVDGFEVSCDGTYTTLISRHRDEPGVISEITRVLGEMQINIAFMQVSRVKRGSDALLVAQTDDPISSEVRHRVEQVRGVQQVRTLSRF